MMPASKKTSPKPNSLLEEARQSATQYQRKKGMQTWFQVLEANEPKKAAELKTLCIDWHKGGESRDLFPGKADLLRFVNARVCKVGRFGFDTWMNEVTS
jgi:hypothetical protein